MRNGEKRRLSDGVPPFVAVRDFAPFGIPRRSGFRAVWDLAPFGISRR